MTTQLFAVFVRSIKSVVPFGPKHADRSQLPHHGEKFALCNAEVLGISHCTWIQNSILNQRQGKRTRTSCSTHLASGTDAEQNETKGWKLEMAREHEEVSLVHSQFGLHFARLHLHLHLHSSDRSSDSKFCCLHFHGRSVVPLVVIGHWTFDVRIQICETRNK